MLYFVLKVLYTVFHTFKNAHFYSYVCEALMPYKWENVLMKDLH